LSPHENSAGIASPAVEVTADSPRIALVHDYLNQRGGAERVALELARLWPDASLFTSLYRPESTFPDFHGRDIRTSLLDRLPIDRRFRSLLPLYPAAFAQLGPIDADVVVASSSGWAHGVRVTNASRLIVYCHNPARWLYGEPHLRTRSAARGAAAPFLPWLRRWDREAAGRADAYVANSEVTRARIKAIYGIDASIIHPPVDTTRFSPTPRGERLLCVSRLLPYKRVDVAVRAATEAGIGLDVVGTGPSYDELAAMAGPTVQFHGAAADSTITEMMQGCRAFCLCGIEDFGMTPVEAQAAGKPVIAFSAGGALETIIPGLTGVFFDEHEPTALLKALRDCDELTTKPEVIADHAQRFSHESFRARMLEKVDDVLNGE
jgi:glycosyltransferase involved in cell wall biosynthesis